MAKITCLTEAYNGSDGEDMLTLEYGDVVEVSAEKLKQLKADFGETDPPWFDFTGKAAPKRKAAASDEDEEA